MGEVSKGGVYVSPRSFELPARTVQEEYAYTIGMSRAELVEYLSGHPLLWRRKYRMGGEEIFEESLEI